MSICWLPKPSRSNQVRTAASNRGSDSTSNEQPFDDKRLCFGHQMVRYKSQAGFRGFGRSDVVNFRVFGTIVLIRTPVLCLCGELLWWCCPGWKVQWRSESRVLGVPSLCCGSSS